MAVLAAGCTDAGSSSPPSTTAPAVPTTEVDGGATFASGGVADLGGVQVRDTSGVVVTLERLVVEPAYVVLEFSAVNGSAEEVALAGDPTTGITLTVDDPAAVMTYQAPSDNETLELASGEILEAEIVFVGVLPVDVSTMDVTFNANPDPGADSDVVEPTIEATDIAIVVTTG